jgi:hypothetical protein
MRYTTVILLSIIFVSFLPITPQASAADADLVFLNGVVITVDADDSEAQAVAVKDGRISVVGANGAVRREIGEHTQIIDLQGRTMTPGFIDAHGHFLIAGRNKTLAVDLNAPPIGDIENMSQLIGRVSERAKKTPKGDWIIGLGYDDTLMAENRHPTRHDLDQMSDDHPIFLFHISLHFAVANTKALEIAGVTADTPQPEGGIIHKDKNTGYPTGLLEEGSAYFSVYRKALAPTLQQNLDAANVGARMYASAGVTTAQDGAATAETIEVLYEAVRRGMMPIRLNLYPRADATYRIMDGRLSTQTDQPEMISIGATKIIQDGSIQGYTGYLRHPYHVPYHGDESYRGYPTMSREKLTELVTDLYKNKRQVAIHGNGDAAIDDILHAVEVANKKFPNPDARPVIIHAQMAQEDQLDRMAELGVIPSFFSLHTYYWGDRHSSIFMGPERAKRMSPSASALNRGIPFTVHCDTPVVPMEPLKLIWATVNRMSTGGVIIGEDQRIGVMDALRATTINVARQNFEEDVKGSIEVGKYADLVVLSEDPRLYPTSVKDIQVLETYVGGRSVYRKNDSNL